jgi:Sigma-70, region 4
MVSLDTLETEDRVILELVLRKNKSYSEIAAMLSSPTRRVRRLARKALEALAPDAADRVAPEWRGLLVDYVLFQYDEFEAKAVRHYLQRSATGRQWVALLVASLNSLYGSDERPTVPHPADREPVVASEGETPDPEAREPVSASEGETLAPVGASEEAADPPLRKDGGPPPVEPTDDEAEKTALTPPRLPLRPRPSSEVGRARRADAGDSITAHRVEANHSRLRLVIWATAVLCGGLAFVMVVFSLVAGVDFTSAPLATLLAILFAAYFAVTLRSFARSEEIGNSRWSDRERRGF